MSSAQPILISRFLLTVFVIFLYASVVIAILRSLFTTRRRQGKHYVQFLCTDCYKGIEKRLSERITVALSGKMIINTEPYTMQVVDVSLNGMRCRLNEVDAGILREGDTVAIELQAAEGAPACTEKGRVVWKKDEKGQSVCGLEFTERENCFENLILQLKKKPA